MTQSTANTPPLRDSIMSTPVTVAADLARIILLLRDRPSAVDEQKAAFRLFAAGVGQRNLVITLRPAGLTVDQTVVPRQLAEVAELEQHLKAHGIGEIRIPAGLMTSILLSLVRTLAAPVGTYATFDHLAARLDASGAGVVQIFPPALKVDATTPPISAAQPKPVAPPPPKAPPAAPPRTPVARGSAEDDALPTIGPDALSEQGAGMMHFVTLETRSIGRVVDEVVAGLAREESDDRTTQLLQELVTAGEMAARRSDWSEVLKAAKSLVDLESKGGAAAEHRSYGIALRRLLPRSNVEHLAVLASKGPYKGDAIVVLRRIGADATEVLLARLTAATSIAERRGYFTALKEMTEGTNLMIHMLSHDEWFVIRNVAELCGELRLEGAVPRLTKQVAHPDERVRRAVVGALAKIGGAGSMEPLRQALRDASPAVRLEAATSLDGRKARGLAMSLAVAAEEETKPDVQKQMYLALGRIASPEALQALIKAAEPGGRFFKRRPAAVRLAAIGGMHAAGPSAANALKTLLGDDDRDVREAVEKALATLWDW